jgi:hypothetical protein
MDYQLYKKSNADEVVTQAAFDDDFAAEKWARQWAQEQASEDDYLIKRADGGLNAQLFRSVAGQWYIMRQ